MEEQFLLVKHAIEGIWVEKNKEQPLTYLFVCQKKEGILMMSNVEQKYQVQILFTFQKVEQTSKRMYIELKSQAGLIKIHSFDHSITVQISERRVVLLTK